MNDRTRRPNVDMQKLADRIESARRPELIAALRLLTRKQLVDLHAALGKTGASVLNGHRQEQRKGTAPVAHFLKTWTEPFEAVLSGAKTFEVRKSDRTFAVGDILSLREWRPPTSGGVGVYTGRFVDVRITFILSGGSFGLPSDLCVMAIAPTEARYE